MRYVTSVERQARERKVLTGCSKECNKGYSKRQLCCGLLNPFYALLYAAGESRRALNQWASCAWSRCTYPRAAKTPMHGEL